MVSQQLALVHAKINIGQTISLMEASHHRWLRQQDLYTRQQATLEAGRLSPEILEPSELHSIITQARTRGYYAPPASWFYENVKVSPFWERPGQLVLRAELPFGGDHHYLLYHLRSWPVPTGNAWVWAQIQTPDKVAVDTVTGAICEPQLCVGRKPKLCRSGAVFSRPFQPCNRGIILGETKLRDSCKVSVIPTKIAPW